MQQEFYHLHHISVTAGLDVVSPAQLLILPLPWPQIQVDVQMTDGLRVVYTKRLTAGGCLSWWVGGQ